MAAAVFQLEFEVRDSELDFQGIVNHAHYCTYMAHTRCKHLKQVGIDVVDFHLQGYDLVLVRGEIDYKASLRGGDLFMVTSQLAMSGKVRFVFHQKIVRIADQKLIALGKNIGVCVALATGKPCMPEMLQTLLERGLSET